MLRLCMCVYVTCIRVGCTSIPHRRIHVCGVRAYIVAFVSLPSCSCISLLASWLCQGCQCCNAHASTDSSTERPKCLPTTAERHAMGFSNFTMLTPDVLQHDHGRLRGPQQPLDTPTEKRLLPSMPILLLARVCTWWPYRMPRACPA